MVFDGKFGKSFWLFACLFNTRAAPFSRNNRSLASRTALISFVLCSITVILKLLGASWLGSSSYHGKGNGVKSEDYLASLEFRKEGEVEIEWRSFRRMKWAKRYILLDVEESAAAHCVETVFCHLRVQANGNYALPWAHFQAPPRWYGNSLIIVFISSTIRTQSVFHCLWSLPRMLPIRSIISVFSPYLRCICRSGW